MLLRVATLSPINLEPVVQCYTPTVVPELRRHGVGRTLVEAAVALAEDLGIAHVMTAAVGVARASQPVHGPPRLRPPGGAAGRYDTRGARQVEAPASRARERRPVGAAAQMLRRRDARLRRQQTASA